MSHHLPLTRAKGARATAESAAPEGQIIALVLITAWAVQTGRVLRPVPVSELSPAELVDFWADDQFEEHYCSPRSLSASIRLFS